MLTRALQKQTIFLSPVFTQAPPYLDQVIYDLLRARLSIQVDYPSVK